MNPAGRPPTSHTVPPEKLTQPSILMSLPRITVYLGYVIHVSHDIPNLVCVLEHFLFSYILEMSSSQLTFIFFRGVAQPPTSDLIGDDWNMNFMNFQKQLGNVGNDSVYVQLGGSPWPTRTRWVPGARHGVQCLGGDGFGRTIEPLIFVW